MARADHDPTRYQRVGRTTAGSKYSGYRTHMRNCKHFMEHAGSTKDYDYLRKRYFEAQANAIGWASRDL